MSKLRIYELAKELGVDNKIVLTKANDLGFKGKSSHSHSLDADEADAIRRAIIRSAVGDVKSANSEVVLSRVDKSTGTTEAVVERRSGNVIRRRRQIDAPEPQKEEIFAAPVEAAVPQEEVTTPEELAPSLESVEDPVEQSEPIAEETEGQPELLVSTEPAVEAEPADVVVASNVMHIAPSAGPKILGRIELPQQRRVVVKPAEPPKRVGKPGVAGAASPVRVEIEDDTEGKPKGALKKGRKREISSFDLADYGNRDGRRTKSRSRGDDRRGGQGSDQDKIAVAKKIIDLGESITVGELARQMSLKSGEVIAKLLGLGIMATINQAIDKDTAQIVADELGYVVKHTEFNEETILQELVDDAPETLQPRSPVVTVMGHVDHGKTSLLDRIRSASVAAKEAGGITQHIGAYSVTTPSGKQITFIDTPGHAAFTSMRARGAQVTDIVILVVAADDGVMPQTKEAINHAQAAKVPIVVAINKMDKHGANPDRIKQQLAELGLQPEDWGGDTMFYPISALKGDGVDTLLEGILLLADVKELKANPDRRAKGTVIESRQDRGRGIVSTVLVQTGTLRVGDLFVTGAFYGKIRTMTDHTGARIEAAGPSTPVEITGLSGMSEAGDDFMVVETENDARTVASNRADRKASIAERALATGPISLEEFAKRASNQAILELNIILKADVQGSEDAVRQSLEKLSGEKVRVRVLHSSVGGVSENDIQLAIASKAIVVGFGVRAEPRAIADAERAGVEIRFYRIIYELLEDVKKAMVGLLPPLQEEVTLGRVEVRETFSVPKLGVIAGCYVTGGTVKRAARARLLRDSRIIYEGKLGSLRRFKDDVREVQAGFECGIGIDGFNDVKIGDAMEIFEFKEVAATLE